MHLCLILFNFIKIFHHEKKNLHPLFTTIFKFRPVLFARQCGADRSLEFHILTTDMMGRVIINSLSASSKTELNVSSLSDGIYFIQVSDKLSSVTKKLVLAR